MRRPLRPGAELGRELGDVAHRRREAAGLVGLEQVAVLLHRRAAAGGRHHDPLVPAKHGDRLLGPAPGLVLAARVERKRPAAALARRHRHLTPVRGEHRGGRAVHAAEEDPLHAPLQHRRPHPHLAARGREPGRAGAQVGRAHPRRQRERAHAQGERPRQRPQQPRPRRRRQHTALDDALAKRPRRPLAPQRPGARDQDVVAHAARAGGHAGETAEAAVEVARRRSRRARSRPHRPASSGGCARAASPSRRPTACRSGTRAGRTRSARRRRAARASQPP